MTLDLPTIRLLAALVAVPVVALGLYKRIRRIASFQKSEVTSGARFATARVATGAASVLLLVIIGIVGVAGASVTVVYALLFIEAASVLVYLALTGAAGFLEGRTRRDHDG